MIFALKNPVFIAVQYAMQNAPNKCHFLELPLQPQTTPTCSCTPRPPPPQAFIQMGTAKHVVMVVTGLRGYSVLLVECVHIKAAFNTIVYLQTNDGRHA